MGRPYHRPVEYRGGGAGGRGGEPSSSRLLQALIEGHYLLPPVALLEAEINRSFNLSRLGLLSTPGASFTLATQADGDKLSSASARLEWERIL